MSSITNMSEVNYQNNVWPPIQNLEPEIITEKKWTKEYGESNETKLTWNIQLYRYFCNYL